ncbi:phenylalanyl-tRNA synthetase beta chain [Candidatus Moduliflexus flocculans]|uniref:phenylalanine--tRNA ligase n=1 Tax=Candidatus Moduliflexus flocculans TaxID=1499966 RepID=A0A081BQ64_9BACT|nr:phenylalanyl-tRNA synthetase beta chain [Candidatus Moduliflexus flocculans]
MPTISVNQNDMFELLGHTYTMGELEALLLLVKGELKDIDPQSGELRIELKDTNRPDLWCPEGIARQIRYKTGRLEAGTQLRCREFAPEHRILVEPPLHAIRPYIGAFLASGVAVTEQFLTQMIQTQEKLCDGYGKKRELFAIGIYDASKLAFPVHYRAVAPESVRFAPLGSDEEMNLAEILARHPKGIEYGAILREHALYPLLQDERGDVLSFPPIINSRTSGEVRVGDQRLFVEVTGMDLEMTFHAVNILAYNFQDRGFSIEPVLTAYPYDTPYGRDVISPYPLKNEATVSCDLFERYLGMTTTIEEVQSGLAAYGVSSQLIGADTLTASTPSYRQDYMHAVDVVEDFAIAVGYDQFEPAMPERFTVGRLAPLTILEDGVRDALIGFGFEEVISNVLSNKAEFDGDALEISNPMSESYSMMRNSLLPSLLKVEAKSSKSLYPHKIFEVGEVALRDETDSHGCATQSRVAAMIAHAEANFSEMGSVLTYLAYLMGWTCSLRPVKNALFIEGRCGEILIDGKSVGIIGEVHPETLTKWGIKMPVTLFELQLTAFA